MARRIALKWKDDFAESYGETAPGFPRKGGKAAKKKSEAERLGSLVLARTNFRSAFLVSRKRVEFAGAGQ
jgi:hypothetical protein